MVTIKMVSLPWDEKWLGDHQNILMKEQDCYTKEWTYVAAITLRKTE